VARPEVVEELLAEIVAGVDIEDEEVRALMHHDVLGFLEAMRDVDLRAGSRFEERVPDCCGKIAIRGEDEDAPAGLRRTGGVGRRCSVHKVEKTATAWPDIGRASGRL
jgi:hypothetical protein